MKCTKPIPLPAKTPAERKRDERARQRKAGRVSATVWIHKADRERLERYVERLNKERG